MRATLNRPHVWTHRDTTRRTRAARRELKRWTA